MNAVHKLVEAHLPGLYARVEQTLADAEARYNGASGQPPSAFLLEHTQRTAAIALKLARMEGVDPFLPTVVALFHDAGKFHQGTYHQDDIAEEEHAAVLAQAMLAEFGMATSEIDALCTSLRSLYDDSLPCVGASCIVQDADRLDKLGALGVGAFFTKATLRGRGLIDALAHTLSRELTYARAAPHSMFTASGKKLAQAQAARSIAFFDDLLQELEDWGIAAFERRNVVLEGEFRTRGGAIVQSMEVTVVVPRNCPECAASIGLTHVRERGIKCDRLTARLTCRGCGDARETYFCLPVLA